MIDYLNLDKDPNTWVLDIETDGLNPSVIWVCCVKNIVTGETRSFRSAEDFKRFHNRSFKYIGHNILSFDVPVLNLLWNGSIDLASCTDTLTLSYLYNPALAEGHSLEAWGQRLKFPKIEFNDWSQYSEVMENYCHTDVELTSRVYKALSEKMRRIGYSSLSCEIEHKIRVVIDKQEQNGFYFNHIGAKSFRDELLRRQSDLTKKIQELFPRRLEAIAEYRFRRTKDGSPFAQYEKHRNKYPKLEHFTTNEGEFYRVFDWVEFNIGSPKQRVERLQEVGWEPDQFTPKGFPKVDEDSLERFVEKLKKANDNRYEAIEAMAEWLVIQGRASMIETWLEYVQSDSRIHGRVLTCGANSRRCTHSMPNSANIPSPHKAKWGKETRGFWGVEPGKGLVEVGVDASGLENVCLLHYLNNPKANEVMNRKKPDDIHTMNARNLSKLLGKEVDREWGAKTCVPLDTRILTREGWKFHHELVIGEEVLGYNQETKLKEWTILRAVNYSEDEVLEFGYKRLRATANHRWFTNRRTGRSHNRYSVDEVRTTDQLTTEDRIIANAPFNQEQDLEDSISLIDFEKYGTNWSKAVLNMSNKEREKFLVGFLLADGHKLNKDGAHNWIWSQNQGEIAEALLLASYLVHDGNIHVTERFDTPNPMWIVRLGRKRYFGNANYNSKQDTVSLGVQKVWCPTTDLGSWVMRQGNIITITGNSLYASLFGAYPPKIAQVLKCSVAEGAKARELLIGSIPGLDSLIKNVTHTWKKNGGRIPCIDGGWVICPSENACLNYLIQPTGACVMKLADIILHEEASKQGLLFKQVAFVHDEFQLECREEDGDRLGKLAVWSIEEAARQLGFKVGLTGEYKTGKDWSECH